MYKTNVKESRTIFKKVLSSIENTWIQGNVSWRNIFIFHEKRLFRGGRYDTIQKEVIVCIEQSLS